MVFGNTTVVVGPSIVVVEEHGTEVMGTVVPPPGGDVEGNGGIGLKGPGVVVVDPGGMLVVGPPGPTVVVVGQGTIPPPGS